MKKITLILFALFAITYADAQRKPKYIFLFIGDGMGFNHIALTEATIMNAKGQVGYDPLNFTTFPIVGFATTHAATRQTTCSAAAGTALATGTKTSIGTIGLTENHSYSLESVAKKAKRNRYKVGVATTVSIDHATPAAFYAHAEDRGMSYEIAEWAPRAGLDLYAGSGLLKPEKGERSIYDILMDSSYTIVRGTGQPLRGSKIFWEQTSKYNSRALPLAIDAQKGDMTLADITEKSIKFLENPRGFFFMVEGGQIDWASHANDAASIVHETYDLSEAVGKALDFYRRYPTETLIIVTADHETGGLALGLDSRNYDTNFELLFSQKISKAKLLEAMKETASWDEAKKLLAEKMSFWDKIKISTKDELQLLIAYEEKPENAAKMAIEIMNQRAGVGFTSGSHTSAYVPVFAIGAGSEIFNGRLDNTDIPTKILSLMSDTQQPKAKAKAPTKPKRKK